jgi:hypothetical protein
MRPRKPRAPPQADPDPPRTAEIDGRPANVFDVLAIDEVQRITGYGIDVVSATESSVLAAIDQYYTGGVSIEEIVQKSIRQVEAGRLSEADLAAGAPIIRLVDQIFLTGVQDGATDIHMEPRSGCSGSGTASTESCDGPSLPRCCSRPSLPREDPPR